MKTLKLLILILTSNNQCNFEQTKNHIEKYWSIYSTAIISALIAIRYRNLNRIYAITCNRLAAIESDISKIRNEIFTVENWYKISAQNFKKTAFSFARRLHRMHLTEQQIHEILQKLVDESSGNNRLLAQKFANKTENFGQKIEQLRKPPPPHGC